jgi:O-methyltransferase involved in polyketide biosynthesis
MSGMLPFDTSKPNMARVYDYMLGGKDNFAADRELADRMLGFDQGLRRLAQSNRAFLSSAVRRAAEAGVSQFLDLGAGLPTAPAVHQTAREVNDAARIAYVDIDPVVVTHASALLTVGPGVVAAGADLTKPADVLANPKVASVIDLSEPVCVLLASVLHFIDPETAGRLVAEYTRRVPSGSWIVISLATTDDEDLIERARSSYTMSAWNHGAQEIGKWLDGLELVPPGISEARRWTSGIGDVPKDTSSAWYVLGAAGVKP